MAMMTGVIEQVATKDVTTKFGTKPTYSFKVNGGWVKAGFKNPNCNVGDTVEFEGIAGTYGVETKTVMVTLRGSGALVAGAAGVPTPKAASTSSYSGGGRVFPIPALHGDRSIVRQNALARAVELVTSSRGGKPFEMDQDMINYAISVARSFEAYTAGDLDAMAAAASEETPDA